MMNTSPQITSVEETIRMPDWRSASPKKRNTCRPHTSRTTLPVKSGRSRPWPRTIRAASPAVRSFDHQDLGVGGEQRLREDVVERADRQERDHDRFVDRPPTPSAPPEAVMPL